MDRANRARGSDAAADGQVAYLAGAIWSRLAEARTPGEVAAAWISLQCGMIPHAVEGVVALATGGADKLRPLASWPEGRDRDPRLAAAAEAAVAQAEGVIHSLEPTQPEGTVRAFVGYPLLDRTNSG